MQLKIYLDEKAIYLADQLSDHLQIKSNQEAVIFVDEKEAFDIAAILIALRTNDKTAAIIIRKDLVALKKSFFAAFDLIEAGGGIVQNDDKAILFIFRRGKWDLPKGKLEEGETIEVCAEREITEETGLKQLTLHKKIGETYHIYTENGKDILKTSHWFYFTSAGSKKTVPQLEEDIQEVKWVSTRNIKEPMSNTYRNIKDILTVFFDTP
jgi:ADP-ribose pyrophosphatase YjhB (NUDIX family)